MAYIDDIVVHSDSWEDHLEHLQLVFEKLKQAGLNIERKKCHFNLPLLMCRSGTHCGKGSGSSTQAKVAAVADYMTPRTKADLRAFLGLVGYYRAFIPNFSARSAHLTDLTSSKHPDKLHLQEIHLHEFQDLKQHYNPIQYWQHLTSTNIHLYRLILPIVE